MQALTVHQPGSIREILSISLPIMLSFLSGFVMLFLDRLILSYYSISAMNAATTATMACYIFQYGMIAITAIAEVYVGKFNGAKEKSRLDEPVWQMLWFCVASFALFIPLSLYGGTVLVPSAYHEFGIPYYQLLILFTPMFAANVAVGAFFIGQGQGKVVAMAVVVSNLVNLVLDICLVFGLYGFKELGIIGAAIATVIAQLVQFIVMFSLFFYKIPKPRKNYKINWPLLKSSLALGVPSSVASVMEIGAWTLILHMVAAISDDHVTLFSIGQSMFMLLAFVTEGLSKGVIATSANFIGAKRADLLPKTLTAAAIVHIGFCVLLVIPLIIFPEPVVSLYFNSAGAMQHTEVMAMASKNCLWVWLAFLCDGLGWIVGGVLTTLGRTKFIMLANTFNMACFGILPIYLLVVKRAGSPVLVWELACFYLFINSLVFYIRYKTLLITDKGQVEVVV